jgi:hypothetical protein
MKSFAIVLLIVIAAAALLAGGQKPAATLQFLVVSDQSTKCQNGADPPCPLRNAEIVLHGVDKKGKQKQEGLELKTHEDGRASVEGIPYGRIRVQVILPHYRTYGEDFDVSQPVHIITIKMERPADQHSIYK